MREIVKLANIGKKYRNQQVLHNINMTFEKGKIYGIIGPNGAGKTTIFKIVSGLARQTAGSLVFFDGTMEAEDARKRISFMIENSWLETKMSVYKNMKLLSILYDSPEERIVEILKQVGLDQEADKKAGNLSLGMKQRLGIAMALLKNPDMIVLDEPMNGLDPRGMVYMRKLFGDLCREQGITIVLSSHLLHELELIADVFYLMDRGEVIDVKSKEELSDADNVLERYYMEKIEG